MVNRSETKVVQRRHRLRPAIIIGSVIFAMMFGAHSMPGYVSHSFFTVEKSKSSIPIIQKIAIVGERNSGTSWMTR
jgi:hypothetical protein